MYNRTEWPGGVGRMGGAEKKGIMCKDSKARKSKIRSELSRSQYDSNPNNSDPCLSFQKTTTTTKTNSIFYYFPHLGHLQSKIRGVTLLSSTAKDGHHLTHCIYMIFDTNTEILIRLFS